MSEKPKTIEGSHTWWYRIQHNWYDGGDTFGSAIVEGVLLIVMGVFFALLGVFSHGVGLFERIERRMLRKH